MGKKRISDQQINKIVNLRKTGHSLPEIIALTGRGNSTVFKYAKSVVILPRYRKLLKEKQGGSKIRAEKKWEAAKKESNKLIPFIGKTEKLCILLALYWGEGTKNELGLINSDPYLIRTFIECLEEIGVTKKQLRASIRIYEDIDREKSLRFWSRITGIPKNSFVGINILKGKKIGKLPYGMCRIRVIKGERYFKLIISMIESAKQKIVFRSNVPVVQRIEQWTPKPLMAVRFGPGTQDENSISKYS